jgi:hypothetical protein
VCAVQKVELRRAWLIEGLDRRNVVAIAETKQDFPESCLVELAALRDDHIAEGKVQRRWIRASVARTRRCAAYQPTFGEQLVRDRIESQRSIQSRNLAVYLFQPAGLSSSRGTRFFQFYPISQHAQECYAIEHCGRHRKGQRDSRQPRGGQTVRGTLMGHECQQRTQQKSADSESRLLHENAENQPLPPFTRAPLIDLRGPVRQKQQESVNAESTKSRISLCDLRNRPSLDADGTHRAALGSVRSLPR